MSAGTSTKGESSPLDSRDARMLFRPADRSNLSIRLPTKLLKERKRLSNGFVLALAVGIYGSLFGWQRGPSVCVCFGSDRTRRKSALTRAESSEIENGFVT